MAAVVYWDNLELKHDLTAPSIPLQVRHVGVNKQPTQIAGYIRGLGGSAK